MNKYEKKLYIHNTFCQHNLKIIPVGKYRGMDLGLRYCNCGIFDFFINSNSIYFPITKYIPFKMKTLISKKIKELKNNELENIKKDAFKRKKCLIIKEK